MSESKRSGAVPARGAGAGGADGRGAPARVRVAVEGDRVDRREARRPPRVVARMGAPCRGRRRPSAGAHDRRAGSFNISACATPSASPRTASSPRSSPGATATTAMAESFNGLYKWALVYPLGPWRGLDDVEFATLGYIDWFNHRRLHGEVTGDNTYVTLPSSKAPTTVTQHPPTRRSPNSPSGHGTRGGSAFRWQRHTFAPGPVRRSTGHGCAM